MKIITISREFSSGGRELGRRLADTLGFDYYDREIISRVAENEGMSERYVESILEKGLPQSVSITFRHSFSTPLVMEQPQTKLVHAQCEVIRSIARAGRDCVIVGRNADVILKEEHPFTIFVCASDEAKIRRCRERATDGERLSDKELMKNMRRIDKNRRNTCEIISDIAWGDAHCYDLVVNTTDWDIKELTVPVAEYARRWFDTHPKAKH